MTDLRETTDGPRFPADDLRVDFGEQHPGSENPMPAEVRRAYHERIESSAQAQAEGARRAGKLFVG